MSVDTPQFCLCKNPINCLLSTHAGECFVQSSKDFVKTCRVTEKPAVGMEGSWRYDHVTKSDLRKNVAKVAKIL